jgi:hypothetical protein
MRISTFVPAILAVSLFAVSSTQALPTLKHQEDAVTLFKRVDANVLDSVVKLFVEAETNVLAAACVDLEADVCADVVVKLQAKADVLGGLAKFNLKVKELEVRTKASADVEIKAMIQAYVKAIVIANIDGHVRGVVGTICPAVDHACLNKNAVKIVADVVAMIKVDIAKLIVKIKADVAAKAKVRVNAAIKDLSVRLGLVNVDVSAAVRVRSDINVLLKAFVDVCAKLLVNAKLVANVAAL